jgi:hypothetical protein
MLSLAGKLQPHRKKGTECYFLRKRPVSLPDSGRNRLAGDFASGRGGGVQLFVEKG